METKTLTLTEFLLARIAEDEAVARTAEPTWPDDPGLRIVKVEEEGSPAEIVVSPERLLAECEVKRRIVELHQPWHPTLGLHEGCATCLSDRVGYSDDWGPDAWPCETLKLLAVPHADHPDYRDEWRP